MALVLLEGTPQRSVVSKVLPRFIPLSLPARDRCGICCHYEVGVLTDRYRHIKCWLSDQTTDELLLEPNHRIELQPGCVAI
jgi:hypothetical protein